MKTKTLLTLSTFTMLLIFALPLLIGKIQFNNTIVVAQNLTERTDGDIENVLSTFNFSFDWRHEPTYIELWENGVTTLSQIF